jgi:tRNA (cytidine/uridine-2'-O-)-methyltransferase
MDDKAVKRAGLDYWSEVILQHHSSLENFYSSLPEARFLYLTTKSDKSYADWTFSQADCLVFGRETRGLPDRVLRDNWDRCLTIPMLNPNIRSLNLATAVSIVLFEALRQTGALRTSLSNK